MTRTKEPQVVLHEALSKLVKDFQDYPFDYLYEADLQARLYGHLFEELSCARIPMKARAHLGQYGTDNAPTTLPLKCEYPSPSKRTGIQARFDIALLDSTQVQQFDATKSEGQLNNDWFWSYPVRAAVELKYLQLGDTLYNKRNGAMKDVVKLQEYRGKQKPGPFLGIAVLFVQPANVKMKDVFGGRAILETEVPSEGIFGYIVTQTKYERIRID